ncbi:MAG: PEP-CTERM sorting domain-containing protein [Pirellulales bacterium]
MRALLAVANLGKVVTIFCIIGLCAKALPATTLVYEYSSTFAGEMPVTSSPWLRATFDDLGASGTVNLKVEGLSLAPEEFVNSLYFNLDPAMSAQALSFGNASLVGGIKFDGISHGSDAIAVQGGGKFDMWFAFTAMPGDAVRFGLGDSFSIDVSGPGLTAESFDFPSSPENGSGEFYTAARIRQFQDASLPTVDVSSWVTVPEPSTFLLAALAGVGLLAFRRKLAQ